MVLLKRFGRFTLARPMKGVMLAVALALIMNFYLTRIVPNSQITALARNTKSPFVMMFCFSLMVVCVAALRNDVLEFFFGKVEAKKKLTPEQIGMMGMVALSAIIFVLLIIFQNCREANIEFHVMQLNKESVVVPGDLYQAEISSAVTVQAVNLSDRQTAFECRWMTSTNDVKVTPDSCTAVIKTANAGMMILTLVAQPPYCSNQYLAPLTIIWQ